VSVVGTRPNLMKVAPVAAALARRPDDFEHVLVHTGQHYDHGMSRIFLDELGLGEPDHLLHVGSGGHAKQTGLAMMRLEPLLRELDPAVVLVPGDVNSTLAATLVAAKLHLPVAHVEAGLRSFDRTMPEEVNRVVVDALAEVLFVHSAEAVENLLMEGRRPEDIHAVGNTMIDTLVAMRGRIAATDAARRHGLPGGRYLLVTLHRPALVDGPLLEPALRALQAVSAELPVVFPVHPRTRAALGACGHDGAGRALRLLEPVGYLEFLSLMSTAAAVLTDSGGIQEETTWLGVPCFTLRDTTERPVTVTHGTNTLLGLRPERIAEIPSRLAPGAARAPCAPAGWDGAAAERIADVLAQRTSPRSSRQVSSLVASSAAT
jgi:UDP-N-acetylglucosamine 2-epimerase (non-hydrolysing)